MSGRGNERVRLALVPPLHVADAPVAFWPEASTVEREAAPLIILLPVADCTLAWIAVDAATPRQAAAAARIQALADAIDDDVHVIAEPTDGPIPVATVSHQVMRHWLGWAAAHGHEVRAVVPAASILPEPEPGRISAMMLGREHIARNVSRAFALEPGLEPVLTGGAPLIESDPAAALDMISDTPRLNLLTGPYAPPRAAWFTRERLRAAAALVALILVVSLLMGVTRLVRVHADIARIDDAVAEQASAALGREVTADAAVTELDARIAATGASRGSASASLAALMQAMEQQASVGIDAASWDRAGTLTVTLGATRAEDINPVLIALQNAGYRITAQPRAGTDGRALGDITIRSEP